MSIHYALLMQLTYNYISLKELNPLHATQMATNTCNRVEVM